MTVSDFGAAINVNIHPGWILLLVLEKLSLLEVMEAWFGNGILQGQAGCGSKQPGLVEDVQAHCRGVGLR